MSDLGSLGGVQSRRNVNIMSKTAAALEKSAARLSGGFKLSTDDVAGMHIASQMSAQVAGMQQGQRNMQDGLNMLGVAGGAIASTGGSLQRMRELAVQASNGTLDNNNRAALQQEIAQLKDSINQTAAGTSFNGKALLDGSATSVAIDPGDGSAPVDVASSLPDASSAGLGVDTIDISTQSGAQSAIDTIDNALQTLGDAQASLGAQSNRLDSMASNLNTQMANTMASRSRLRDTDVAQEIVNFKMLAMSMQSQAKIQTMLTSMDRNTLSSLVG